MGVEVFTTRFRQEGPEGCWEQGLTPDQVSIENSRQALKRLGVHWQRAKS